MSNAPAIESSADIRQLLYQRSQVFRNVLPFGPAPNPKLKWLYTSAMQKAIRRGHSEIAAMCAASLAFRRKLGERQLLFFLVDELCASVKDRSLCDLAVLNHNRAPPTKLWRQYIDKLNCRIMSRLANLWDRSRSMGQHPKTEKAQPPLSDCSLCLNP